MNIREGKTCEVLGARCKVVERTTNNITLKAVGKNIYLTARESDFRLLTNRI